MKAVANGKLTRIGWKHEAVFNIFLYKQRVPGLSICFYSVYGLFCPEDIPEPLRSPHDAICLAKQFMSSSRLSQRPILILPHVNLQKLKSSQPNMPLPTKKFSGDALKEFRKTATKIEQAPYELVEGSNYLRSLIDRSERGEHPQPLPLKIYQLREDSFQCQPQVLVDEADVPFADFAPGTPKRMEVHDARPHFPRENAEPPLEAPMPLAPQHEEGTTMADLLALGLTERKGKATAATSAAAKASTKSVAKGRDAAKATPMGFLTDSFFSLT